MTAPTRLNGQRPDAGVLALIEAIVRQAQRDTAWSLEAQRFVEMLRKAVGR
jgi:hypothetical protein